MKAITATEFKKKCLNIIGRMTEDRQPVTVTKRGVPVAIVSPVEQSDVGNSIYGAMRGTVLEYTDPFLPATDPAEWDVLQ
ncbi:MAG: type II toxin-antitoxin system prevent-host-death family antitoxin [Acidiferrobacterales bacterium]|nr:type II toxin-antitoxin system prevent-host-death family antitoxin [Acidiferrobacterales bacterium]